MTRILAPWAKGLRYLGFRRLRRRNIKFGRIHRGQGNVGRMDRQAYEQSKGPWDHRGGRPDPHAPPLGHALGIAQKPQQWNGRGRYEDRPIDDGVKALLRSLVGLKRLDKGVSADLPPSASSEIGTVPSLPTVAPSPVSSTIAKTGTIPLPLDPVAERISIVASISYDSQSSNITSLAPNQALRELATLRARSSGSDVILPRHLTEAAQALKRPSNGTITSPAAVIPIHYDYLCTELSKISDIINEDEKLSAQPPRVLVIGEVSGVVSSMFRLAGAQVATCDLLPSEIDY
eukprot:scaffold745_cov113-Isochrysis_galbana.AAC.1